ncbi:MAG: Rne/Rng family ribonuclease [Gemmatimonadota bacterium]
MKREIFISATPQETRVAILEDDVLVEVRVERADAERIVGDIYLGHVQAVLPGIQAAFVEIGTEKAGFLHVSDVLLDDDDEDENGNGNDNGDGDGGGGRRRSRRYPPIQDLIAKGDSTLVQVTKEPISTKGPRVTRQVSLPGRFVVYMPYSTHVGVSRKIEGREERSRLRALAKEILPKDSGGVIIRTVGEELTRDAFERELNTLISAWKKIEKRATSSKAPAVVHREAKLVRGVIRDVFSDKVDRIVVDQADLYSEIRQYLHGMDPGLLDRVQYDAEPEPLFDRHGIEDAIQVAFERRVDLKSGGYLVIEPTEALVSIDVNTGRFTGKRDPDKTILRTNLDAAREVARQLRLRDMGGIIVVDFIDMEVKGHQDQVMQELRTWLGRDRARTKAFHISELGLVQMTRQRVRPSLYQAMTERCTHCGGAGRVFTPETVLRRVERALKRVALGGAEKSMTVRVHPEVALYALEEEHDFVRRLQGAHRLEFMLRDDPLLRQDEYRLLAGSAGTDVTKRYAER